jgi:type IV secretory pathway protease TraF
MTGRATTLLMMLGPAALALSTIAAKPAKRYIWNASASVPVGLYRLRPTGSLWVTELVTVQPSESLATFLSECGYLPRGVPMLKCVMALPGRPFAETGSPSPSTTSRSREARERDSLALAARYLPGCVAASLPNAKSS